MTPESAPPAEPQAVTGPLTLDRLIETLAGPDRRVVVCSWDGIRTPVAALASVVTRAFEERDGDGNDVGWEEAVVTLATGAVPADAMSRRLEAALRKAMADGVRGRLAVAIARDGRPGREMITGAAADGDVLVLTLAPHPLKRDRGGSDAGTRQLGSGTEDGGFCVPRLADGSEPMKTRRP